MTVEEIIGAIKKGLKIDLSTRERNWIKDNLRKRKLHIDSDNLVIDLTYLSGMNPKLYTIIQNGKSRKLSKLDHTQHAIVVNKSGLLRVFQPEQ